MGVPGGSVVKNLPANAGDSVSIPGSGRAPRGGNGSPLQSSCLENLMDRGAWQARVHGVIRVRHYSATKNKTRLQGPLSDYHTHYLLGKKDGFNHQ